jgi:hypothetical protein
MPAEPDIGLRVRRGLKRLYHNRAHQRKEPSRRQRIRVVVTGLRSAFVVQRRMGGSRGLPRRWKSRDGGARPTTYVAMSLSLADTTLRKSCLTSMGDERIWGAAQLFQTITLREGGVRLRRPLAARWSPEVSSLRRRLREAPVMHIRPRSRAIPSLETASRLSRSAGLRPMPPLIYTILTIGRRTYA